MIRNRIFATVISTGLVVSMLAACAAPAPTAPAAPADTAPADTAAPADTVPADVNDGDGNGFGVAPPSSPHRFSMAAGSIGGVFYILGSGIAQVLNSHQPEFFNFTAEATGGGGANLTLIQAGDAELGIAMTSSLSEAKEGIVEWTGGREFDNLRVVLGLYPGFFKAYTLADSGIYTMADIEGRIVGLGTRGMSMDATFRNFFDAFDITPSSIHNDGHGATATAVGNGIIDVGINLSFPPFAAIVELESTRDLRFIPLNDEEIQYFIETYDFYEVDVLPEGSYRGVTEDIPGMSEWNMLVSSVVVDDDLIYVIVRTLLENQADVIATHPSAAHMSVENTLRSNIYLHSGAVRALIDMGYDVPAELIPPEFQG
jgi:TRAP transporter TAXI family solute receptor